MELIKEVYFKEERTNLRRLKICKFYRNNF